MDPNSRSINVAAEICPSAMQTRSFNCPFASAMSLAARSLMLACSRYTSATRR
jgi:hypothetical protein